MATNRLPAPSQDFHDNSTINLEIGARSQAACGSTLTLGKIIMRFVPGDLSTRIAEGLRSGQTPQGIAYEVCGALESDSSKVLRSDNELSKQEVYFRDMIQFHSCYMGNGFDDVIATGNGRSMFIRALRSTKEIGLTDVLDILEGAIQVFECHSVQLPTDFNPEWWTDDPDIVPEEIVNSVRKDTENLTKAYW